MGKEKIQKGDRKDAYLVRDVDPLHIVMSYILGNRCENEAVLKEIVDLTEIEKYVAKKNESNPQYKYTMFHVFCAIIAKIIALRPKMNYFFANNHLYERKEISETFIVKKILSEEESKEGLAIIKYDKNSEESPVEQVHSQLEKIIYTVRVEDKEDDTSDFLGKLVALPRFILKPVFNTLIRMNNKGKLPKAMAPLDPYTSSCFISNVGSIKLTAQYHHLSNWSSNSFFCLIGEKHMHPYFYPDGKYEMKQALEIGITLDERIADGTYYAKSIRLLRYLVDHPEELDKPLSTEVEFEDYKNAGGYFV